MPPSWLDTPEGILAAILVLDQFPRNMFRSDARCFATDAEALALAKQAISEGMDVKLNPKQRAFVYLPFQHSEDPEDQARAVGLFSMLGNPLNLDFALRHKAIVDSFGEVPPPQLSAWASLIPGRGSLPRKAWFIILAALGEVVRQHRQRQGVKLLRGASRPPHRGGTLPVPRLKAGRWGDLIPRPPRRHCRHV